MAPQAFVCPHCRTWVEGEGRSIRCPSCGKRFRADEARLGRGRVPATFEAPDFETPGYETPAQETPDYEVPTRDGWDFGEGSRRGTEIEAAQDLPTDRPTQASPDWPSPRPVSHETTHTEPDVTAPAPGSEPWYREPMTTGPTSPEAEPEPAGQRLPWRWILSIGLLVLIFAGGQFLSGELFVLAFLALIAAQWFLERDKSDS